MPIAQHIQYLNSTKVEIGQNKTRTIWHHLDPRLVRTIRDIQLYTTYRYSGEHLELLAYRYYGDITYNWVLMIYNAIINPILIPDGKLLRIPDQDQVNSALTNLSKLKGQLVDVDNPLQGQLVRL